ncbi:hypothetical protein CCACVL1_19821 [Corchorus capsularis]|uniref:Uncharacterized protein n=1 Tax=Corchorus capsularis TaxID=210143 RepID=A0A1R3HEX4_COCAP|nr:hypothetical protein CCACVL1_19821 [Corchorus capsularis]
MELSRQAKPQADASICKLIINISLALGTLALGNGNRHRS